MSYSLYFRLGADSTAVIISITTDDELGPSPDNSMAAHRCRR